jgi:hypothetical protein
MPLVDLKTNLKSLKYGNDRLGNGSSREPFITEPIPEGDTPGASTDFLLRQGAIKNSGQDVSRLTQLLFSTTRGFLFTTGNNLLSRTSIKTEATLGPAYAGGAINQGVYSPTSTIAQSLAGFSGTHLNLLGINPNSPTAGVVEGDLFPDGGLIRYEQVARDFNNQEGDSSNNRLVSLYDTKISGLTPTPKNSLVASSPLNILSYSGGPGSILGIGNTITKRTTNTTGINEYGFTVKDFLQTSFTRVSLAKTYFNDNYSSLLKITDSLVDPTGINILPEITSGSYNSEENFPRGVVSNNEIVTLKTAYEKPNGSALEYTMPGEKRIYKSNPNFQRNRYGNPGLAIGKKQYTYTGDKFNATNTDKLNTSTVNEKPDNDQLFKFYLNLVDPQSPGANNYLYWQAYVDNFNDQVGANYDEFTYTGRGYPSFRYKGFTRAINLDFTIVATSPDQIVPIYKKLNTLIQNLAPNYSSTGYIRGNFVKLTFGDYLTNVPGIIKGFSINPIFDAGFDIGGTEEETLKNITSGKQLPKALKISGFNFVPIASNDNKLVSSDSQFFGGKDNLLSKDNG